MGTIESYEIKDTIGHGVFGTVYKASINNELVAIKCFSEEKWHVGQYEADILKILPRHKNLPYWIEDFMTEDTFYIVMPFIKGKELWEYKEKEIEVSSTFLYALLNQMIDVLVILHDNNIVYRDMKHENIICDDSRDPPIFTLIDFDSACYIQDDSDLPHGPGGTFGYLTPVQVKSYEYYMTNKCLLPISRKEYEYSDVFALGVVLFTLMEHHEPFKINPFFKKFDFHLFNYPRMMKHSNTFLKNTVRLMLTAQHSAKDIQLML